MKYFHLRLEKHSVEAISKKINKAIKRGDISNKTSILISWTVERYEPTSTMVEDLSRIARILQSKNIDHWTFITNTTFPDDLKISKNVNIIRLEFWAISTVYNRKYKNIAFNSRWNPDAAKALLLMAKIGKRHRFPLLYKLIQSELIDRLEYSFYPYLSATLEYDVKKEFEETTGQSYKKFAKKYARSADKVADPMLTVNCFTGYEFDVELYKNTALSIISETENDLPEHTDVSEKIFNAIANNHPFIIIGQHKILEYLKNLGFRTFENYLLHQEYDLTVDLDKRITQVVENTEYFLNNYTSYIREINNDIEHNQKTLENLVQATIDKHEALQDEQVFYELFHVTSK